MCVLSVTTTSSTLRDMGSCEEEGLFSRSFPEFLGVRPTERELLLKVTNFGLPDSLSALISHLPNQSQSAWVCVCRAKCSSWGETTVDPGAALDCNSNFIYGGVFVNNTTENIKKRRSKLILYHFTLYLSLSVNPSKCDGSIGFVNNVLCRFKVRLSLIVLFQTLDKSRDFTVKRFVRDWFNSIEAECEPSHYYCNGVRLLKKESRTEMQRIGYSWL
jgi:hypothetical protein